VSVSYVDFLHSIKCQSRFVFPWTNYQTVSKGLWVNILSIPLVERKVYLWFGDKSGVASGCSFLLAEAAKLLGMDDLVFGAHFGRTHQNRQAHQPLGGLEAITTSSPRAVVEGPTVSGKSAKESLSFNLCMQCA
jgi:hypothetical protein